MPTYDYECDACDHKFELYQGINEEVKKKCPECGKNKLRRLIGTGGAIIFKGSGFYQTDYRGDAYKKAQAADKPESSTKSESSSSESKSSAASSNGASTKKSSGTASKKKD